MAGEGWAPLLEFTDEGKPFALGFEAGRIWEKLRSTDDPVVETVHVDSAELFMRMAEATERTVRSRGFTDGGDWVEITFGQAGGVSG